MRVAVVTTSYPSWPGQAAGHFVEAEVHQRRARGERVTVIAPGSPTLDDPGRGVWRAPCAGLFGPPGALPRLKANPLRAAGIAPFAWRARQLLERHGPFDTIVAHWLLPSAWPIAVGQSARLEAVAHGSDVRLLARLPGALRRHIARQLARDGCVVRCVSEHVRERLLEATGAVLATRTTVAASPFELPPGLGRQLARERLGLDAQLRLIVVVARLIPEKRVATALTALVRLPCVRVVVVGGGPLFDRLSRDYPEARFTGDVPRSRALEWMAAADVLVSASRLEGAPTAVREARALGTRVVAVAAGSLPLLALTDPDLWLVPEQGT